MGKAGKALKIILLGLGSIGQRHARNLHALGHHVIAADPFVAAPEPNGVVTLFYRDWRRALAEHGDAQGCVIASPTAEHHAQLLFATFGNSQAIPVYIEKPIMTAEQYGFFSFKADILTISNQPYKIVTGFQYLFHPAMPTVRELARQYGELSFVGRDNLLARYGPDVDGVMVAHPVRTSLALLGPALDVSLISDGVCLTGHIFHKGGTSHYDFDMGSGPRESWVRANGAEVALTPDDGMYVAALAAWTTWLAGGPRDPRLSSLSDGLEVTRVLSKVSHYDHASA